MNIHNKGRKIVKNTFGNSVYSKPEHDFPVFNM